LLELKFARAAMRAVEHALLEEGEKLEEAIDLVCVVQLGRKWRDTVLGQGNHRCNVGRRDLYKKAGRPLGQLQNRSSLIVYIDIPITEKELQIRVLLHSIQQGLQVAMLERRHKCGIHVSHFPSPL